MKILSVNFSFSMVGKKLSDEVAYLVELKKYGHSVSTITTDAAPYIIDLKKSKSELFLNFDECKPIEIFGMSVYVLHCHIPQLGWYCLGARKLANKIVKNFDVIYIRGWYHHLAIEFYKAAKKHNIPFVFGPYATLDYVARTKYMKKPKLIIDKIYTKKMIQNAGALVSYGESEKKELLKFGADPKKIFRFNLTVNLNDFKLTNETNILSKFGIDKKNQPYILFLGRVTKKKGVELLINAFAKLDNKNLNLIIAGSSDASYQNELIQLCTDLEISNFVKFIGPVYGSEKNHLYHSAQIFALTSYSDVHPVASLEALAMGKPVLLTKNCDFPEITDYEAGILVDANINSVYEGLVEILSDESRLKKMSVNAKKLVEEKFLFKDKVIEYEQLFQFAINN